MNKWIKTACVCTLAYFLGAFLVAIIGTLIGWVEMVCFGGFLVSLPFFILFAFADRFVAFLRLIEKGELSLDYFAPDARLSKEARGVLLTISHGAKHVGLAVRAVTFGVAAGVVESTVSLVEDGISGVFGGFNEMVVTGAASITLACIDLARGRTIGTPGLPGRILAVAGALQFYRALLILMFGWNGARSFAGAHAMLTNPLWFVYPQSLHTVLVFVFDLGIPYAFAFFVLFPVLFYCVGRDGYDRPTTDDNRDSKHFALAMVIFACWVGFCGFVSLAIFLLALSR